MKQQEIMANSFQRLQYLMIIRFLKNWTLPIAILCGMAGYIIYVNIPWLTPTHKAVANCVAWLQPCLIFCMLFITFCEVRPQDLRPHRWQLAMALIQITLSVILAVMIAHCPSAIWKLFLEGCLLCLICPTATAAAVVTMKLGGDAATITTYTIIINIVVAIAIPLLLPIAHPQDNLTFLPAFLTIMAKVFPLLICPFIAACMVRYCLPRFHHLCLQFRELAFYLWAISLALAIAVTCKAIAHSHEPCLGITGIAIAALICCIFQFAIGKAIGGHFHHRLEGGQGLGQKNTVFIIWLGYTFLSPVTALAGGFYSICHNVVNSYQLYRYRKTSSQEKSVNLDNIQPHN